jgi:diguanylate cyclase
LPQDDTPIPIDNTPVSLPNDSSAVSQSPIDENPTLPESVSDTTPTSPTPDTSTPNDSSPVSTTPIDQSPQVDENPAVPDVDANPLENPTVPIIPDDSTSDITPVSSQPDTQITPSDSSSPFQTA